MAKNWDDTPKIDIYFWHLKELEPSYKGVDLRQLMSDIMGSVKQEVVRKNEYIGDLISKYKVDEATTEVVALECLVSLKCVRSQLGKQNNMRRFTFYLLCM